MRPMTSIKVLCGVALIPFLYGLPVAAGPINFHNSGDLAILDAVQPQPTTPLPILATIVPELKKRQGNGDNNTINGNGNSQSNGNGNVSNSSNPHGLSQSDKIAIGVGVGGGVVAIVGVYYTYRQFKQHSKVKAQHQPTPSAMPSSPQSQHYGSPLAGSHSLSGYRNELPT